MTSYDILCKQMSWSNMQLNDEKYGDEYISEVKIILDLDIDDDINE